MWRFSGGRYVFRKHISWVSIEARYQFIHRLSAEIMGAAPLVLIESYENGNYSIDPPAPIEAIKCRMEKMNLSIKDLEKYIAPRGRVSEVLNRGRGLSLNTIRNLHSQLHIPLESLIGDSRQHA